MKILLMNSGIFGLLSVVSGMLIEAAGLVIILLSKSRMAHRWALTGSFLPLILGVSGTLVAYFLNVRPFVRTQTDSLVKAVMVEICSPAIVGVAVTAFVFVSLGGLFLLKRPSAG